MKPSTPPTAYAQQRTAEAQADAGLVQRIAQGDEQALVALYDRWHGAVRALAQRIVGDATEAEDVVEEVFWQAWRQADRFDAGRGSVATWLLTLARSRSLDRLRAIRRARVDASLDDEDAALPPDVLASRDPSPADAAEGDERARLVAGALATLQPAQRECLELAYFSGLSQSEIAERTGAPLGTVKTRMRLALRKLRDTLTPTIGAPLPPPRARRTLPIGWFGAATLGLAASLVLLVQARSELREARVTFAEAERLRSRSEDSLQSVVAEQDRRLASLTGGKVRVVELTTQDLNKPYARMFWDQATHRWTFVAHRLPALAQGRTYQLWLVSGDRKISAGTFVPDARGEAVVRAEYALAPNALAAVAVTEEPAGGVPQPTGAMIVVGKATQ